MKISDNVLNEFEEKTVERSKLYHLAITLSCIFICFGVLDIIIDFESLSWKEPDFEWLNLMMTILIPVTGLIFTLKKIKMGWIIFTLYFSLISALSILATAKTLIENDSLYKEVLLTSRQFIIMGITTVISILFQLKTLRVYLRISRLLWISTIISSLCLAAALITLD